MVTGVFLLLQITLTRFIPNHILFGIAFMILIIIGKNISIFKNRILAFIGKISYSAYFVHFAVLSTLARIGIVDFCSTSTKVFALTNMGIRFLIVLALVVAISTITHYLIEVPMQNLGKKLIKIKNNG